MMKRRRSCESTAVRFTLLVAICCCCLIAGSTPAAAAAAAVIHSSAAPASPWPNSRQASTHHASPAAANVHVQLSRGGATFPQFLSFPFLPNTLSTTATLWWQSLFPIRPKQYRFALEQQIQWLEQQIIQVMEEKRLLEKKLASEAEPRYLMAIRLFFSQRKSAMSLLRKELGLLQKQLEDLQSGKEALEEMLVEQQERIEELSQRSKDETTNRRNMRAMYQQQVDELTKQLHEKSQNQLARLDALLEQRIAAAQERARQEVWEEGKVRIAQLEARLSEEYERDLAALRTKTQLALDKQRLKMDALSKAIAIREQKLLAQHEQELLKDQERKRLATSKVQELRNVVQRMKQERMDQDRKFAEREQYHGDGQDLSESFSVSKLFSNVMGGIGNTED